MRSSSNRILLILLIALFSFPLMALQNKKMTVAVLDLDPTGVAESDAQFLSDRLRTELFETGKFQIVEREKMNDILEEQGFQQSGCTSIECAVEIGQLLNVQVMIAGNIGKIEDLYSLSIRMIDVSSGAIIRTATKDYEGRLSEVLTEVVPETARELATGDLSATDNLPVGEDKTEQRDQNGSKRFAILVEGGFSSLTYTNEINKEIEKLPATVSPDIEKLNGFFSLGLEFSYFLSADWLIKIGFIAENPLTDWKTSLTSYTPSTGIVSTFDLLEIERSNRFVNTYLGVNYTLWSRPQNYEIYLGVDIGSTALSSDINFNYQLRDGSQGENSTTSHYSSFTLKILLGGGYYLSRGISAGMQLQFKSVQPFNISDQNMPRELPEEIQAVFFPEEINASGLLVSFFLGFHF